MIANPTTLMRVVRSAVRKLSAAHPLSPSDLDDVVGLALVRLVEAEARGVPPFGRTVRFAVLRSLVQHRTPSWERPEDEATGEHLTGSSRERETLALWQLQRAWPMMSARQQAALRLYLTGHEFHEIGEALGGVGDHEHLAGRASAAVFQALGKVADPRAKTAARTVADKMDRRCKRCDRPLPPTAWTGPPRQFCGGACRMAFDRARRRAAEAA